MNENNENSPVQYMSPPAKFFRIEKAKRKRKCHECYRVILEKTYCLTFFDLWSGCTKNLCYECLNTFCTDLYNLEEE